jgi:sugar phosphate permease
MDGVAGKAGWRWIFILEGIVTVVIGAASFFMVRDFPDQAKFLSQEDRLRVYYRLKDDQQASAEHETFKWSSVKEALKDWKTWTTASMFMGNGCSLYAVSLSLPTIVRQLGYSSTKAQLLTVPPYFVAACCTILVSWIADRTRQRGYCTMVTSGTGILGFILLMSPVSSGVKYFALYLAAGAIYPCVPLTIAWTANNTNGTFKRAIVMGIVIGWSNMQGVIGSNVYQTRDAPRFLPGHAICMSFLAVFLFGGSIVHRFLLVRENAAKVAGKRDHLVQGKSAAEIALIGDRRYAGPFQSSLRSSLANVTQARLPVHFVAYG